jgi:hypothetical protein
MPPPPLPPTDQSVTSPHAGNRLDPYRTAIH